MSTQRVVQGLWSLCDILRDDGITYHQYVTDLTLLLFLKMAQETATEHRLPAPRRWADVKSRHGVAHHIFLGELLIELGVGPDRLVAAIYANAGTWIKDPRHLAQLIADIKGLNSYSARQDGLGNLDEGRLEKNAGELKSGAGQHFTPRALIKAMTQVVKPQPGELMQDRPPAPAAS
ncbi:N-6 DNA methylase [Accumulibacter sp.]|uniref:type I restriction-modification system subunit M N-terminal domain-containing protein n=1 Tax=Accumulibacter sp. TaxID=2053492 RepID=UPI0025DB4B60|nr:N-6 DNA methylase [Accumulibacter sp.]MCM8625136.1 N-6 DNA methylase [Accumulibacter sp.]